MKMKMMTKMKTLQGNFIYKAFDDLIDKGNFFNLHLLTLRLYSVYLLMEFTGNHLFAIISINI